MLEKPRRKKEAIVEKQKKEKAEKYKRLLEEMEH